MKQNNVRKYKLQKVQEYATKNGLPRMKVYRMLRDGRLQGRKIVGIQFVKI